MSWTAAIERRLVHARDLPVLLDAAHEAFEALLSAIEEHEDPTSPRFVPFLMAGTCAANGRDAILFAPSLPPRQLPRPPSHVALPDDMPNRADEAVAISTLLADRLIQAATWCVDDGDQASCASAAACARQIQQLLTSGGP